MPPNIPSGRKRMPSMLDSMPNLVSHELSRAFRAKAGTLCWNVDVFGSDPFGVVCAVKGEGHDMGALR